MIDTTAAWRVTKGFKTRVAVLDTGYAGDPIAGRVLMRRSFLDPGRPDDTADAYGHGTQVVRNLLTVAPACYVLVARVQERAGVSSQNVARGIDWAVRNGAGVINLSVDLGPRELAAFAEVRAAIVRASAAGVILVGAAGNTGDEVHYPARWPQVIAVGEAWDRYGNGRLSLSTTSCRGADLDAVAPTWGFRGLYGTSFAAPVVSGAAALYLAAGFAPADFRAKLWRTGHFVGGYPVPDLAALVA